MIASLARRSSIEAAELRGIHVLGRHKQYRATHPEEGVLESVFLFTEPSLDLSFASMGIP